VGVMLKAEPCSCGGNAQGEQCSGGAHAKANDTQGAIALSKFGHRKAMGVPIAAGPERLLSGPPMLYWPS
jgi:hypothetical protein